jgi:alpha-tubulin suppressor-like RCC1 family protein
MLPNEEDKDVLSPVKNSLLGVVQVSLGVNHTCVITREGKLFAGGDGTSGQLGCHLT